MCCCCQVYFPPPPHSQTVTVAPDSTHAHKTPDLKKNGNKGIKSKFFHRPYTPLEPNLWLWIHHTNSVLQGIYRRRQAAPSEWPTPELLFVEHFEPGITHKVAQSQYKQKHQRETRLHEERSSGEVFLQAVIISFNTFWWVPFSGTSISSSLEAFTIFMSPVWPKVDRTAACKKSRQCAAPSKRKLYEKVHSVVLKRRFKLTDLIFTVMMRFLSFNKLFSDENKVWR